MGEKVKILTKKLETKRDNLLSKIGTSDFLLSLNSPVDHVFHLQRAIGNQAVQRLLKSGVFQAKFKIDQTGDIYEQEADRVAEQIMRMPEQKVKQ